MPKKRSPGDGALYWIESRRLWRGVVSLGENSEGKRIQRSVTHRTRKGALDKLNELKRDIDENGGELPSKAPLLSSWAEQWLTTIAVRSVDPKTYATYRSLTKRWIIPALGRRRVDQIRASHITSLRISMIDTAGLSTSTTRQAMIVLSRMLDAAKADRLFRHDNPAKLIDKPSGAPAKKRGALESVDVVKVLEVAAAMPDATGARWWWKLFTGMRQGEMLGATLADLTLPTDPDLPGTYQVHWKLEQLAREHDCGGTCGKKRGANCPAAKWRVPEEFEMTHLEQSWCLTRPKSRTGRVVPIIPSLAEAIRRHIQATRHQPNPHGLIWHQPNGSPIQPADDSNDWRALLLAAGVISPDHAKPGGTEITGHVARHTTVTVLAEMGVDMSVIADIVGHSSESVTEIYRHARKTELERAAATLATAWKPALERN